MRVPTDGHPGVFATLDAGAKRTVGVYFMYDVKQVDPAEWTSPPYDAAFVDKPGLGKSIVGRGAVNQKGPEAAFLAALHAFRNAGRKLPVNLVLVAEGEEEIGSPHFTQIIQRPEVKSALARTTGVFMPSASQSGDGVVLVSLGAKGIVELEMTSSGEKWGRGPRQDIHSSNKARVDSPAWHLVQALHTLVNSDGEPAIDGFADRARPISAAEKAMVAEGSRRFDEAVLKKQMGVQRWIKDAGFLESLERLVAQPTVNIEGLVGGYTGPGGKTVLPHKAVAKLDLRLVPDMKASEAIAALQAHLAKRGFGDIEARMTGGYDPTSTPADDRDHPGAGQCLQTRRRRAGDVAPQRGILARIRIHGRAAQARRGALRNGPRRRRARSRRVLRHRVDEPEDPGIRRRGALVRGLPAGARGRQLTPKKGHGFHLTKWAGSGIK